MNKPKVIKDFLKLPEEMQEEILEKYPKGYSEHLILFTDKDGKYASALPYETEDKLYLLRMPKAQVQSKSEDDEDDEDDTDDYGDLDTMKVGGGKNDDDDDEYD